MFRTLAAILLVSSAYASAQSTQVADDPKRLQGIWRVREVHGSDEAKAYRLQMHLAFEGNKLFFVAGGGAPGSELSYSLDPLKDPKQIDLVQRMLVLGQRPPANERVIVP